MTITTKPTFIFVGGPKCGSTWIYRTLKVHPEVYVPPAKDIYFFDRYYHKGLGWYFSLFKHANERHKAIGEVCHDYLYSEVAAQRIKSDLPEVKVFACLRNPIDRLRSGYLWKKRNNFAKKDLRTTLKAFPMMLHYGMYSRHVESYMNRFGKNFKVFIFDDLRDNPREFALRIYEFIGVDQQFKNELAQKKALPAAKPRIRALGRYGKRFFEFLRIMGFPNLVGRLKSSSLYEWMFIPLRETEKDVLLEEDKDWLRKYYYEDVLALSELLERDLSHWLNQ